MAFTGTSLIASGTGASTSSAFKPAGPCTVVISHGALAHGESVTVWGEDADGDFVEELFTFRKDGPTSQLIEYYLSMKTEKTVTATALAVGYGS